MENMGNLEKTGNMENIGNPGGAENFGNPGAYEFNTSLPPAWVGDFGAGAFDGDMEALWRCLRSPQTENRLIRDLCWQAYAGNGFVRNIVDFIVALPALDRVVFERGGDGGSGQPEGKALFERCLGMVRDREVIRDALLKNCCDGASFYYFVSGRRPGGEGTVDALDAALLTQISEAGDGAQGDRKFADLSPARKKKFVAEISESCAAGGGADGGNWFLLPLPVDFCKIVGFRDNSYVAAFDLGYFSRFPASLLRRRLLLYPPEIRRAWADRAQGRAGGGWVVMDPSRTVVTKIGSRRQDCWGVPLVAGALQDVFYYQYFTQTKRNMLDSMNNKVFYQTFPEGRDKGTSALTGAKQEEQHNVIKNGLNSRKSGQWGLTFFSLAAGTKLDALNAESDLFDSKNEADLVERICADMGFAAPLLNGVAKGNYASLKLNLELQTARASSWVAQIGAELEKVINLNAVRDPGRWFELSYLPTSMANREEAAKEAKELYSVAKGSLQAWLAAAGHDPAAYLALLDEELAMGVEDKYPPHRTSYTMQGQGGRPPSGGGQEGATDPGQPRPGA